MADEPSNSSVAGTVPAVAWEMCKYLRGAVPAGDSAERVEGYLDLYARCYEAASGKRKPKS